MNIGNQVKFKDGFMPKHTHIIGSINGRHYMDGRHIKVATVYTKIGDRTAHFLYEPQDNLEVVKDE